jgi:hypothetical protein
LVGVHVLLSVALPLVHERFISILETVEEVLTISVEGVSAFPSFSAEASKDPPILILDNDHRCVMLSAILEESDQTASVLIEIEHPGPITLPVETWQAPNEIGKLQI